MEKEQDQDHLQFVNAGDAILSAAVYDMLTAGNGIASALITLFGPTVFMTWKDHTEAQHECYARLGSEQGYIAYELWQAWFAIHGWGQRLTEIVKTRPPFTIIVNGEPHQCFSSTISYTMVVIMAIFSDENKRKRQIPDQLPHYSVTYRGGWGPKSEGSLTPGNTVNVRPGMIFNAFETGNA